MCYNCKVYKSPKDPPPQNLGSMFVTASSRLRQQFVCEYQTVLPRLNKPKVLQQPLQQSLSLTRRMAATHRSHPSLSHTQRFVEMSQDADEGRVGADL